MVVNGSTHREIIYNFEIIPSSLILIFGNRLPLWVAYDLVMYGKFGMLNFSYLRFVLVTPTMMYEYAYFIVFMNTMKVITQMSLF